MQIESARLEREREEIAARLPEDAEGEPLTDEESDALRIQVSRLAARREQLGQVNPLAAEEHARETERLRELTGEREDLENSLAELDKLRGELTDTVEKRFEETYAAVEQHFSEVVATLFPGGRGRLVATEGDEDEEHGIEIELSPAGKRVTKLSLLSGGEKALGAISFLFALFLARPCPFYLLDEVEAALDDANIGRFVELLRRFSDRAQFIVVTHQKRTMEAADALYGVTMGADGISQVVSKRLTAERSARSSGVTRTWQEFLGGEAPPPEPDAASGWFSRLRDSLSASRKALAGELLFDPADDESWERVEEALIGADVGVPATVEIVRRLEERQPASEAELLEALEEVVADLVAPEGEATLALDCEARGDPRRRRERDGQDDHDRQAREPPARIRALGDPRRRGHVPRGRGGAARDLGRPRAGRFRRLLAGAATPRRSPTTRSRRASARGKDVVIVDTAGRLHTQTNLMEELAKVRRVIAQRLEGAPHETLLVVDATTGQNGLQQARLFGSAVEVTGVALTKLDGSAKGGIAIAIAHELGIPVKLVGVGETLDDLQPFDARDFARALVEAEIARVLGRRRAVRACGVLRRRSCELGSRACTHARFVTTASPRPSGRSGAAGSRTTTCRSPSRRRGSRARCSSSTARRAT